MGELDARQFVSRGVGVAFLVRGVRFIMKVVYRVYVCLKSDDSDEIKKRLYNVQLSAHSCIGQKYIRLLSFHFSNLTSYSALGWV